MLTKGINGYPGRTRRSNRKRETKRSISTWESRIRFVKKAAHFLENNLGELEAKVECNCMSLFCNDTGLLTYLGDEGVRGGKEAFFQLDLEIFDVCRHMETDEDLKSCI